MDSPGSQGVPRFSSFRPPPTSAPTSDAGHESGRHSRRRSRHRSPEQHWRRRSRHRSPGQLRHQRPRHRSRVERNTPLHDHRERENSRGGGSGESIAEEGEETEPLVGGEADESKHAEGEANAEDLGFVVDVQGDRDITRYGANQYESPAYRRSGTGFVVGLPGERVDYETRHENTLITLPANRVTASQPKLLSALDQRALHTTVPIPVANRRPLVNPANPAADIDDSADFISTDSPPGPRVASSAARLNAESSRFGVPPSSNEEEDEAIYEESVEHQVDPSTRENEILNRNAELIRAVKHDPLNARGWIRLAEHQELVILGVRPDDRPLNENKRQAVVSAILSIYDNALDANPQHPERDRLVLGRMEQGAKVWDPEELSNQWEKVLRSDSKSVSVWVEYLDYCQTNYQKFDFDTCYKAYLHCMNTHSRVGSGRDRYLITSYLFLRLTLFLREAGYLELAMGYWQAILEFVVFRPPGLADNHEEALRTFKMFWSPAYVKIGEHGWRPWNAGYDPYAPKVQVANPDYESRAYSPESFESWTNAERERMMRNRMPSHEFEPLAQEGGVFEVPLLADCTHILQCFRDFAGTFGVALLIDAFLQFCHLPHFTCPANLHTSRLWIGENFLRNQYMDDWQNKITEWMEFHDHASTTTVKPFAFSHHTFIPTADSLFSNPELWFSCLAKWAASASRPSCIIKSDFVVETLFSLAQIFEESSFGEYAIAVSFACDRDRARKHAKALLKQRPNNLRLWNSVALMDWRTGNKPLAEAVWSKALMSSREFPDHEFVESALLWNSWIWEKLHAGENDSAAYLLNSMREGAPKQSYEPADQEELKPADILRLTQLLRNAQSSALECRGFQAYAAYTDCLAIIRYILDASIGDILKPYDDALQRLSDGLESDIISRTFGSELLHQARAKLVYHYVTTKPAQYRPIEVRNIFLSSLEAFPHNTMFLALFKWNDARVDMTHRFRDIIHATIGEKARTTKQASGNGAQIDRVPITTYLFNIYCEMGRPRQGNSSPHLVRAAFERAIGHGPVSVGQTPQRRHLELNSSTSAQNNLTIWKLYVLWEARVEHDFARARKVLFRALRACPWSKELYMLAFEHLRDDIVDLSTKRTLRGGKYVSSGFSKRELQALYSEMVRRGIRIHHHLVHYWADENVPADDNGGF
ncbi:Tetratricopeptide-like helical [Penicillium bovifimosum]|uniref:Tetratricopeptide-like helical n=1 Tax=Penicillium bovifimosum TaxID=126998 RepID=A0A9W9H5G8_9EURO|nr:Tetratricopeptide-like helical [Penicillium bovifimosum]KAJ5138304.1 Tetratricopeptide-like helical [Penicillium bovifimosum]